MSVARAICCTLVVPPAPRVSVHHQQPNGRYVLRLPALARCRTFAVARSVMLPHTHGREGRGRRRRSLGPALDRNAACFMQPNVVVAVLFVVRNYGDMIELTENDGHENDGPSKFQDMKLQDMKLRDQMTGHEIAGHENARHVSCNFMSCTFTSCNISCPTFSCLAFSCPAILSAIFMSCNFMPCNLVR